MNWFKKNIFETYYYKDECQYIYLFGIKFDFRQKYLYREDKLNENYRYLEYEVKEHIHEVEKKNARRKNKIPIPVYEKIPFYKTLITWSNIPNRIRSFIFFIVGILLGFLLGMVF